MKTKFLSKFLARMANFDTDVEMVDIFKIAIHRGALSTEGAEFIFDSVNEIQHPRLAARECTLNGRKKAVNHLKSTIAAAYLKDIYEDLTEYLSAVLKAAALNGLDPGRLVGESKLNFLASDLLKAGSWDGVVEMVSKSIFRTLEGERSTKELLQKMNLRLNLGVTQGAIDSALPYLDLRHLLVHSDGVADANFCKCYPALGATQGKKIDVDYELLQSAKKAIVSLVTQFDRKVVQKSVVSASYLTK